MPVSRMCEMENKMTHFSWHFRMPVSQPEFEKLLICGRDTVCPWPLGLNHSALTVLRIKTELTCFPTPPRCDVTLSILPVSTCVDSFCLLVSSYQFLGKEGQW